MAKVERKTNLDELTELLTTSHFDSPMNPVIGNYIRLIDEAINSTPEALEHLRVRRRSLERLRPVQFRASFHRSPQVRAQVSPVSLPHRQASSPLPEGPLLEPRAADPDESHTEESPSVELELRHLLRPGSEPSSDR